MTRRTGPWILATACVLSAQAVPVQSQSVGVDQQSATEALAHRQRGEDDIYQAKWEEASTELERALELEPSDFRTCYLLGVAYNSRGQLADPATANKLFDKAIVSLKAALALKADSPETLNELGTAYNLLGRRKGAMEAYRQAIELRPEWDDVRFNLAGVYAEEEMTDLSLAEYRRLLEHPGRFDTALHRIHNGIGLAYQRAGKGDEAIAAFRTAVELNPEFYDARINLGNAYLDKARYEDAVAEYKQAIRLQPGDPGLDYLVGVMYMLARKDDLALEALERAVEKGFDARTLKDNVIFRRLFNNPRFQRLIGA